MTSPGTPRVSRWRNLARLIEATFVGSSAAHDIAVLKIQAPDHAPAPGDSVRLKVWRAGKQIELTARLQQSD